MRHALGLLVLLATSLPVRAGAATVPAEADTSRVYPMPPIEVVGDATGAPGPRTTASQGVVGAERIAARAVQRTGDVLEHVPGLLISQHSGEGKANQYYLRGFNLDHGTDFATTIAGFPVNLPSHAHGQGYTDLNFLVPELVRDIRYRKGTYAVEDGDFSSAGSARIAYRNTLPAPLLSWTVGEEGYRRALAAASRTVGAESLLACFEVEHHDGPWVHPDRYRKLNGLARWSHGGPESGWAVTGIAHDGRWNSTDQVPARAVAAGALDRLGAIDPSDGGTTTRYGLAAQYHELTPDASTFATVWVMRYRLDLFSNFTYFLNDSLRGDQLEQADDRRAAGARFAYSETDGEGPHASRRTVGVDLRHDDMPRLGLYHTQERRLVQLIRQDRVRESSVSPFVEIEQAWTEWLRASVGVRGEWFRFSDEASYPPFTGTTIARLASPKASVAFGPWRGFECFLSGGHGFHSVDARGTRYGAADAGGGAGVREAPQHFPIPGGPPVRNGSMLVRTRGAEVGATFTRSARATLAVACWGLDIDSEQVFLGDAGFTSPNRPSRRVGVEVSSELYPARGLRVAADLATSRARFRDADPAGDRVPGAVNGVASADLEYAPTHRGAASMHVRWFGPRPLTEDGSVRSPASTMVHAAVAWHPRPRWTAAVQVFNLFDRRASDIDYYYTSRLLGEPTAGVDDRHFHPQGPRTVRVSLATGLSR